MTDNSYKFHVYFIFGGGMAKIIGLRQHIWGWRTPLLEREIVDPPLVSNK